MTHRTARRLAAALLVLLAPAACDSPTGNDAPVPAQVAVVSGDLQTQTVGKELAQPLVVRVTDDRGRAVVGQAVAFVVTAGNGSVANATVLTDANGQASTRWTLGTVADSQRVEARAASDAGQVLAIFHAVGTADVPSSIAAAGPTSFTGLPLLALADSVAAVVRDAYGNPVPGTAVVWTVKQGGGSVSPSTTTTGATGVARTSWTLGAVLDSLQVIEAAAGLTLKTQFTANGHVPADAMIVKVSGDAQTDTAGQVLPQPLVVRVQRANGTPIAGIPVTFTLPAGSGSVTPATSVTNAAGQVSVQWTLGTGTGAKTAVAGIGNGASATFTATALAGATAALVKVSGDLQTGRAGSPLADSIVFRSVDANGNPVAGALVQVDASRGGSVTPRVLPTRADGTLAVSWTLGASSIQSLKVATYGAAPIYFRAGIGSVYFSVISPWINGVVGDTMPVEVHIDSASASVASVKASVGGSTTTLTPVGGGTSRGTLSLAGMPWGTLDVRFTATTVAGDSSVVVLPVNHDTPPTVTFTGPHMGTVARPSVRVDVDCVDDSGNCLITGNASTGFIGGGGTFGNVVFQATNSIHQDVSLAAYEGLDIRLRIFVQDAAGHQQLVTQLEIPVESSPRLTEIVSAGDRLIDFDATRAVTGDQRFACCIGGDFVKWAVRQTDRGTGAVVLLDSGTTTRTTIASYKGWLHPQGALFVSPGGIYDWRSGTSTRLTGASELAVANGWAAYSVGTGVYRRDLATGAETLVGTGSRPDMADNGDVAFHDAGAVWWAHGGPAANLAPGSNPVTDGVNLAFLDGSSHVILRLGAGGTLDLGQVAPYGGTGLPPAHAFYEVENGWTAYLLPDGGGIAQVWVRSPAGDVKQVASLGQSARLVSLGNAGQVVYASGGQVYVARYPYTAAPVRVFADLNARNDVRWRGSQLLFYLGRTAFDVSY